jgi:hypothetical protein
VSKFPTSSLWASFAGRFIAIGAVSALSALSSVACSADAQDSQVGDEESDWTKTKNATPNEVLLMVSVDWEGRDLTEANISAMESLRTRYPDVRITHFLNAAYFTKPGAVASDVAARMERPLRPNDEQGLHIHGWKRLFEAAGVTFRATPTFWGEGRGLSDDCSQDCGHEVPISAYTEDELRKVVHFSLDTLETNGFTRAKSFRCGGWARFRSTTGSPTCGRT